MPNISLSHILVLLQTAFNSLFAYPALPAHFTSPLPAVVKPAPPKTVISVEANNSQISLIRATVTRVLPDMTMEIALDDKEKNISLLGIAYPEDTEDEIKECLEENALESYEDIVGKTVFLTPDADVKKENAYYVFKDDSSLLNEELLKKGLASFESSTSGKLYRVELETAEKNAQDEKAGIWAEECEEDITPTEVIEPSPTVIPTAVPTRIPTKKPIPTVKAAFSSNSTGALTILSSPVPTFPVPTAIPVTPTKVVTPTPWPSLAPASNSLSADLLFILINLYRKNKGLPAYEKDANLCALASSRAPELYDEIFVTGKIHQGFYDRNIPYWITENMAAYGSEDTIMNFWLNSTIHRKAIEGNYKYSCGACKGTSCAMLFTSWVHK